MYYVIKIGFCLGEGAKYAIDCVGGDIAGLGMYNAMAKGGTMNVYGALSGEFTM